MTFRKTGDKARYSFVDLHCIGRTCWAPGMYQHRSPLSCGGSRNTGSPDSPCCLNRAPRGCPEGPYGMRTLPCDECNGGAVQEEGNHCRMCGGSGEIRHTGLPVPDKALAAKRKAEGWKKASVA